ncbi:hypothetical protein NHQ30_010083 [Ciborinia camelliae]|nr:hypothetical protein NHQ30_010083 [Ciborinia camelliae]
MVTSSRIALDLARGGSGGIAVGQINFTRGNCNFSILSALPQSKFAAPILDPVGGKRVEETKNNVVYIRMSDNFVVTILD